MTNSLTESKTKCNQNATNNNGYFIDVTNLGLHNKDLAQT